MAENNLQYIVKSTLPRFEYPNVSVAKFFAKRFIELSSDSDLIAFIDPTGQSQLTYKEFYQKVQELAYSLLQKGVKKSDVFLFFADNSIDHAVAIFAAIFIGVTVTLLQPASGPFELYDRIQKANITVLVYDCKKVDVIRKALEDEHFQKSIAQLNVFLQLDSPVPILQYGGSKFPANILRELKAKYNTWMFECYGSTEFFGHVNILKYGKLSFDDFQPGNLGQVMPNVEMKIVDLKTGKTLPANEHGEICFKGSPCFIGYLNDEEATRNTIDSEGFYHSGDIGFFNEDHCLFVTDRIKELIKYKIWSVIPAEIEEFLYRHKAVAGACVIGVRHSTDGNLVRAYVQLADGTEVAEQELIDFVKDNMGFQKQLRGGVRFVSELPRTGVGKVDRQYFKQLVKDELITEAVP
ncbi:PREDICTED: 4-coumarate--CoA ligase 1-like [Rhagoletis zephyria]|uniref:4-coumarate--CoA ligase 1-like n=1 Tax=Rhagoletis zephyria TaxID=28612 RepID=UPI00081198E6|nr:PREDICTED: 4-coumarate--CoA ligase 1-like [Rhagoletis zephyria]